MGFFRFRILLGIVLSMGVCPLPRLAQAEGAGAAWDEKYANEPYVVLLSEEDVTIGKDYATVRKIRMKAKVQNEGGKVIGEIPVRYDQSREEVKDLEAFTVTPDGKKIRYEKVQDLNASGQSAVYTDERVKEISMPNVVV